MAGELQAGGGPVEVALTANTKPFEAAMDRAVASVEKSTKKMESRFEGFRKTVDEKSRNIASRLSQVSAVIGGGVVGQVAAGFSGGLVGGLISLGVVAGKTFTDWANGANKAAEAMKASRAELERTRQAALALKLGRDEFPDSLAHNNPAALVDRIRDQIDAVDRVRSAQITELNAADAAGDEDRKKVLFSSLATLKADKARFEAQITDILKPYGGKLSVARLVPTIDGATAALEKQATTWGLVGREAERALFKAGGATDAMLKRFDEVGDGLEGLAQFNGPLSLGGLDSLLGAGAARLLKLGPLREPELPESTAAATGGNRLASALVAGSSGAANAIAAASNGGNRNDPQTQTVPLLREIMAALKAAAIVAQQQRDELRDVVRNTDPENWDAEMIG